MASSMVHGTDASTCTSTGTESHIMPLNNHPQHEKFNGVIDGTISIMWQEPWYCYICNKKLICPLNATYKPHVPIGLCVHTRQLWQYMCLILTNHNQQCNQELLFTYSHIGPWPKQICLSHHTCEVQWKLILFVIPLVYYQYIMLKYLMSQYHRFVARCRNK